MTNRFIRDNAQLIHTGDTVRTQSGTVTNTKGLRIPFPGPGTGIYYWGVHVNAPGLGGTWEIEPRDRGATTPLASRVSIAGGPPEHTIVTANGPLRGGAGKLVTQDGPIDVLYDEVVAVTLSSTYEFFFLVRMPTPL